MKLAEALHQRADLQKRIAQLGTRLNNNAKVQEGDEPTTPFSYDTLSPLENKVVCHVSWTNENTKNIILKN